MTTDYQPYAIDGIEQALRARLDAVHGAHDLASEAHRRLHEPDYALYTFRDETGKPQWQEFLPEEKTSLLAVNYPRLLQLALPSLRGVPLVTGADIQADAGVSEKGILQTLKRRLLNFVWDCGKKDASLYMTARHNRWIEMRKAETAWHALLPFHAPRLPVHTDLVKDALDDLVSYKNDQVAKGEDAVVWITPEEQNELKTALKSGELGDIFLAASSLKGSSFRLSFMKTQKAIDNLIQLQAPYADLTEIDDPDLLRAIKTTLKLDGHGEYLLDLAETDGVRIHLMQRDTKHVSTPYDAGAYVEGHDVYLIDADAANIGDEAVTLGHELRHYWQRKTFAAFFRDHDSPIDSLIRTRLIEADAYAFQISSAFVLKQKGVPISRWSSAVDTPTEIFEQVYDRVIREHAMQPEQALNFATATLFAVFAGPGPLDSYEQKWALTAKPQQETDLPALIARSPYYQTDFILALTVIDSVSYLHPEEVPLIQRQLGQIGQSEHAKMQQATPKPIEMTF